MTDFPRTFPHHRLTAYDAALDLMVDLVAIAAAIPRGHRHIAHQLERAATGIVANLAEGANRRLPGEKRQRFTEARGEAGEAAAWLEISHRLGWVGGDTIAPLLHRLDRLCAMLSGLIRRQGR